MPFPASLVALSAAAAASAALAVRGHYAGPRRTLVYVFKPLTTLLILAIALRPASGATGHYAGAVAFGALGLLLLRFLWPGVSGRLRIPVVL